MSDPSGLWAMAAAFFVVAVAPGPATLACATVSAANGRQAGLQFGLGLGVALTFWGVLAATGLGAVLVASANAMIVLKLLGGAYLLWLAFKSGRSAMAADAPALTQIDQGRWFARGILLNASNPKAIFAWVATLSIGIGPNSSPATLVLATALCAAIGFAVYLPWILGFSHPRVMSGYRRAQRWVDGVVASIFAIAGLGLIRSALARA